LIFVYHINTKIVAVETEAGIQLDFDLKNSFAEGLSHIAIMNPSSKIVWCHMDYRQVLNIKELATLFHHDKLLLSFQPATSNYIGDAIGYVDESVFVNVNKKVSYPTWQMSSAVGMVHASVMVEIKDKIPFNLSFDYYLSSVAKLCMPVGLLCYSEPDLLKISNKKAIAEVSNFTLFRFVKQHYKMQWVFLLFFNLVAYERKFPVLAFLASFFYRKRNNGKINFEGIKVMSSREMINQNSIDVIIPTIGRKKYLYDVLKDFRNQTLLPKKVIIVEQNPEEGSQSELDYIQGESWPFEIIHFFIHQSGVCNARNLALDMTENEWVFLADDDNRFGATLLADVFDKIEQLGNEVVTVSYLQQGEDKIYNEVKQWGTFGAGNSFVRRSLIDKVRFNKALEFGYGEDADFGAQLRNLGADVIYLPKPDILHLKAPMGGFRTKPSLEWHNDKIQPKPSPTVMLYQLLHQTKEQQRSYKTTLFLKYYTKQKIKNPFSYYINYKQQWNQSILWATILNQKQ
jgi:GT2 family glycosyltransferase